MKQATSAQVFEGGCAEWLASQGLVDEEGVGGRGRGRRGGGSIGPHSPLPLQGGGEEDRCADGSEDQGE